MLLSLMPGGVAANVRGLPQADWPAYAGATFSCRDGSATLPAAQLNDDYCDCADGSDEPGTSACPNSRFHCVNTGFKSKQIFSSLVNDGVCDCCDGSDEWATGSCKDECVALGAVAKAKAEERARLVAQGYEISLQWAARGEESRKTTQAELEALNKEIEVKRQEVAAIDERKSAAEEVEKKLQEEHRLKKEAEAEEKQRQEEAAQAAADAVKAATDAAADAAKEDVLEGEETEEEAEADRVARQAALEAAAKARGCKADPEMECDAAPPSPVCVTTKDREGPHIRTTFATRCAAEMVGYTGLCAGYVTEGKCDEGADWPDLDENGKPVANSAPAAAEGVDEAGYKYNEDDFKPAETEEDAEEAETPPPPAEDEPAPEPEEPPPTDPEAEKLRAELREAQSALDKLTDRERDLKEGLEKDYGPNRQFEPLKDACFEIGHGEWIYELCPFNKAEQKGKHGGGSTSLGRWSGFANGHKTMEFKNGQACWNGPIRSMTVTVSCGGENKVTKVDEPETCKYVADFETPAACTEEDKNLAQAEVESCTAPEA